MLIEQIIEFELKGPGPPGRTCTPLTGELHDKTKTSKENLRVDYYLLLKYWRQCALLTSIWTKSLTIKILHHNAKILNVFWTLIASKRKIKQLNFCDWLSNVKNLILSNGCEYVRNVIQ